MNTSSYFQKTYHHCPKCKAEFKHEDGKAICPHCGHEEYNSPSAAIIALITNGNQILLGKRKNNPKQGKWDQIGGFVDAGERVEDTVIREVKEETGLTVKIDQYLGSIPDTYGDNGKPTINMVYTVTVIEGTPTPQDDVEELKWFDLDDIPTDLAFKNTAESIDMYISASNQQ